MATSIFVMAHKPYAPPADPVYKTMFVGAQGKQDIIPGCFRDDVGEDNISDLNPYFSELTGLYWLWKNYPGQENIGICHYRRFFINDNRQIMTGPEFDDILKSYDIITTKKLPSEKTNRENYAEAHYVKDMDLTGYALKKLYPEYAKAYDEMTVAHGNYFGNLFVTSRELFDEYCTYLFSILTEVSSMVDMTDYDAYEQRLYGFLSEFLLMPFVQTRELRVDECPVAFSGEKAETRELELAVEELLRQGKTAEAKDFFSRMLELRPDLTMPDSDLSGNLELTLLVLYIKDFEEQNRAQNYVTRENELSALLTHLKKCYEILRKISNDEELDPGDIGYMKFTGFDKASAEIIAAGDPSERFGRTPLDREKIDEFFA